MTVVIAEMFDYEKVKNLQAFGPEPAYGIKSSSWGLLYLSNILSMAPPKRGNLDLAKFFMISTAFIACASVNPSAFNLSSNSFISNN